MEIKGQFIQKLSEESGISATGKAWRKQAAIIETIETYPKKVCLLFFGDKVDHLSNVYSGVKVTASVNIESREFNGKWYTNIDCWKLTIEASEAAPAPAPQQSQAMQQAAASADFINDLSDDQVGDDLPF